MVTGMQTIEIPIELECWMLRNGILDDDHRKSKPDVTLPPSPRIENVWKPSFDGEQPPF
jgi:hypothetical protein